MERRIKALTLWPAPSLPHTPLTLLPLCKWVDHQDWFFSNSKSGSSGHAGPHSPYLFSSSDLIFPCAFPRAVKSVVAKKVPPIIIDPEDAAVQAAELRAKMELDAAALDDPELAALLEQENSRFRSSAAGSTSSRTTLQPRQGSPSSSTRQNGSFDSHNRVDHSGSNNFASGSGCPSISYSLIATNFHYSDCGTR